MANFSKADRNLMTVAMKKLYGANNDVCNTDVVKEWMTTAPVALVEYEGLLGNENAKAKDRRMEDHQVYSGDISKLIQALRKAFPQKSSMPKWELIFTCYNEIMSVQDVLTQAQTQLAFSDEPTIENEVPQTEELPNSQSSSKEETVSIPTETTQVEVSPVSNPTNAEAEVHTAEPVEDAHEESAPTVEDVSVPTGSVGVQTEQTYLNNSIKNNKTEETKMDAMENLMNAAQAANPAGSVDAPAAKPKKAGISEDVKNKVVNVLADTKTRRDEYTKSHQISDLVATQRPAALRMKATQGRSFKDALYAKPEELQTALNEKLAKLVVKFSGDPDMTVEAFEAATDDVKFFAVKTDTDENAIAKAKAIWDIAKRVQQNPQEMLPAYQPNSSQISYQVKGVMLEGKPYTMDELVVKLMDETVGGLYGEGSCDEMGNPVGDKPTIFKVQVVTSKKNAKGDTIAQNKTSTKSLSVKITSKREFINNGQRVQFLFEKIDDAAEAAAVFRAAIPVNGETVPANVVCIKCEKKDGKLVKIERSRTTDKEGNVKVNYKTQPASWTVSVPVSKVVKEFGPEYKSGTDLQLDCSRWSVSIAQKADKAHLVGNASLTQAAGFAAFAAILGGEITIEGTLASSDAVKKLTAAANEAAAATAAETSEGLE